MQVLKVIYYFKNTKYNINAVIKVDCIDICDEIALFFTVTITLPHHLQSSSITSLTIVIVLCLYSYHSTSFTAIIHRHHSLSSFIAIITYRHHLPSSFYVIILCHHSMSSFYVILLWHHSTIITYHLNTSYAFIIHHQYHHLSSSFTTIILYLNSIITHHYSLS